jgi:hypothetical protein
MCYLGLSRPPNEIAITQDAQQAPSLLPHTRIVHHHMQECSATYAAESAPGQQGNQQPRPAAIKHTHPIASAVSVDYGWHVMLLWGAWQLVCTACTVQRPVSLCLHRVPTGTRPDALISARDHATDTAHCAVHSTTHKCRVRMSAQHSRLALEVQADTHQLPSGFSQGQHRAAEAAPHASPSANQGATWCGQTPGNPTPCMRSFGPHCEQWMPTVASRHNA